MPGQLGAARPRRKGGLVLFVVHRRVMLCAGQVALLLICCCLLALKTPELETRFEEYLRIDDPITDRQDAVSAARAAANEQRAQEAVVSRGKGAGRLLRGAGKGRRAEHLDSEAWWLGKRAWSQIGAVAATPEWTEAGRDGRAPPRHASASGANNTREAHGNTTLWRHLEAAEVERASSSFELHLVYESTAWSAGHGVSSCHEDPLAVVT